MNINNYTDLNALQQAKANAKKGDAESMLRPVAQQFEAMMLAEVLKNSRANPLDEGWLNGQGSDIIHDLHDKQISQNLSTNNLTGLSDLIVEELKKPQSTSDFLTVQNLGKE